MLFGSFKGSPLAPSDRGFRSTVKPNGTERETMSSAVLRISAVVFGIVAIAYLVASLVIGTVRDIDRRLEGFQASEGINAMPIEGSGYQAPTPKALPTLYPTCREDEAFLPTHYLDPEGTEDRAGVTRKCQAIDDYYALYWRA